MQWYHCNGNIRLSELLLHIIPPAHRNGLIETTATRSNGQKLEQNPFHDSTPEHSTCLPSFATHKRSLPHHDRGCDSESGRNAAAKDLSGLSEEFSGHQAVAGHHLALSHGEPAGRELEQRVGLQLLQINARVEGFDFCFCDFPLDNDVLQRLALRLDINKGSMQQLCLVCRLCNVCT